MFRISTAAGSSHTTVTIDGQLIGDCVEFVEKCCEQALSGGMPVRVFLRDVSMVDQAARAMLGRLCARGVRLLGGGVYTSYLARELDRKRGERAS